MQFKIHVVAIGSDGDEVVHAVASVECDTIAPETVGLRLAAGKAILRASQPVVVEEQVADHLAAARQCPACGTSRRSKGKHDLPFRTGCGTVHLASPRLYHCPWTPQSERTVSPLAVLLPDRTSPELAFLTTKWASLAS